MFQFDGKMAQQAKQHIIKANRKNATRVAFVLAIILFIPTIVLMFLINWSFVLIIPVLFLFVACSGIPPKDESLIVPDKITIDEEEMTSQSSKFLVLKNTSDVKTIIDYGDCYVFHFATLPFVFSFVCQKNLITKGTIEDFENFFKDKIQRAERQEKETGDIPSSAD